MAFIEINQNFGQNTSYLSIFIITILSLWLILLYYSIRKNGVKKTIRYFFPMILVALFVESTVVSTGLFHYPGYLIYFSILGGSVPLIILIGWSLNLNLFLNFANKIVSKIYNKKNMVQLILISVFTGLIGICLDLLEDPIAHHNEWWVWNSKMSSITFYQVPLSNYFDWFIILFYTAFVTLYIERSGFSENRKLALSLFSISFIGIALFITHGLFLGFAK